MSAPDYIELPHQADAPKWAMIIQAYGSQMQQAFSVSGLPEDIADKICAAIATEDPLLLRDENGGAAAIVPLSHDAWVRLVPWDEFTRQVGAQTAAARFGLAPSAPRLVK